MNNYKYDAVVFDLLTGLIDSWSLWNEIAGSDLIGQKWRGRYLEITYNTFKYQDYEKLVLQAARDVGFPEDKACKLFEEWERLSPWPEVVDVLNKIKEKYLISIATNCSIINGNKAINRINVEFDFSVTAEEVGFYKPHSQMYLSILKKMNTTPGKTLFVAGSPFDVIGAKSMGMDVYWHNRIGLNNLNSQEAEYNEKSLYKLIEILNL